jgi:hypothetical protein
MSRKKVPAVSAVAFVVAMLPALAGAAGEHDPEGVGFAPPSVTPCSLAGINPAYHPEVFANAATARQFGFVKAKNGAWQVAPNCRRQNSG